MNPTPQKTSNLERWRRLSADALMLGALVMVVWITAGFLLRDDLFIFGDHAGHYWRMWYTLNIAWPQHHRIIDWIPYWYAGYPEMQFYPPLYVILGWLLNLITWGKLSTAWIYEIIVFVSYALPGFTFYYAIRHLGFNRRAAFTGGLFGLIFPVILGGAGAPFIGMIGSRMAFGLNALVLVWTIDFLEARGARYVWLSIGSLALAILAHTYHEIGIVLALGLYVLIRRLPWRRTAIRLVGLIVCAFLLDAFWAVPLGVRSSSNVIPILRATLDQTWRHLIDAAILPYALLALPALARLWRDEDSTRRAVIAVFTVLPLGIAAIALSAYPFLIERLNFYQIDPVRILGEYYFPIIFLAAIGTADSAAWLARFSRSNRMRAVFAWGAPLTVCAVLLTHFFPAHAFYYPRANDEPRFLRQAIHDYRLNELWETLRATEGRVMFTSHYTRLSAHGSGDFDTTIAALTPLFTQRQLMGGTYSHWSPIAAFMWVGTINPPVLRGRVEEWDDRALFGVPLERISDAQVYAYCRRFNITTIVAGINDFHTRTFLDASRYFQSYYNNGFFFVYRVNEYENAWFEAHNADVDLISFEDTEIVLRVRTAQDAASVNVKVYAYPLWRARTDTGQTLVITRDDLALMQISLPRGENYTVTLRYEESIAEHIGKLVSILAGMIFAGSAVIAGRVEFRFCSPDGAIRSF